MIVDEKIIRVLFVLIGLFIAVLLRMYHIEKMVRQRPDMKTVETVVSTHLNQTKSELSKIVESLSPEIEDSVMAVGGVCAYESFRNKRIIATSLIIHVNGYNHLNLLDQAIEAVDELVDLLNDFIEDIQGSRKLTSVIVDLPSLDELHEEYDYYANQLETLIQLKEEVEVIGR